MIVRVKLCGVTRRRDAVRAAELGVDAVGFNFVRSSPRHVTPERARDIGAMLPPFVTRVGVFADEPPEAMLATAAVARVHCLQLHGDETPETCASLTLSWFKAHPVTPWFLPEEVARYGSSTFLLDGYAPGARGGTGRGFDWGVARRAAAYGRVIVAGGLTPESVEEVIEVARPYGVDVNSGVELSPGQKDPVRLSLFMRRVSEAAARIEGQP